MSCYIQQPLFELDEFATPISKPKLKAKVDDNITDITVDTEPPEWYQPCLPGFELLTSDDPDHSFENVT
ncbi:MAG: hypothetical protein OHK0023_17950 [Anaerolineae bacterium]